MSNVQYPYQGYCGLTIAGNAVQQLHIHPCSHHSNWERKHLYHLKKCSHAPFQSIHRQPLSDFNLYRFILSIMWFYVPGVVQYAPVCGLTSYINIVFLRFIHVVVAWIISGLFIVVNTHTHTTRHFSITSMSMGHFLGLLLFLQIMFLNFQCRSLTIFY